MSELWSKIKEWKGWPVIVAILRVLPKFLFKTKTGLVLIGLALNAVGIIVSEDELKTILELIFAALAATGTFAANEPMNTFKTMVKKEYDRGTPA